MSGTSKIWTLSTYFSYGPVKRGTTLSTQWAVPRTEKPLLRRSCKPVSNYLVLGFEELVWLAFPRTLPMWPSIPVTRTHLPLLHVISMISGLGFVDEQCPLVSLDTWMKAANRNLSVVFGRFKKDCNKVKVLKHIETEGTSLELSNQSNPNQLYLIKLTSPSVPPLQCRKA